MKKIILRLMGLVGLFICMPLIANEKVALCREYTQHLSAMKNMQYQTNFSFKSKQWKDAEVKKLELKKA